MFHKFQPAPDIIWAMLIILIIGIGILTSENAQADSPTSYNVTLLNNFTPHHINSHGIVAGQDLTDAYPGPSAAIWDNGSVSRVASSWVGHAQAINDNNTVVGEGYETNFIGHPFVWDSGTLTELGDLGDGLTIPRDVNNLGQVVGTSATTSAMHAFLWQNNSMTDLGTMNAITSEAVAINNNGQIAGFTTNPTQAFLWQGGVFTNLGTLGGSFARARGLNDSGQVVGYSRNINGEMRAFLYHNGTMSELASLGGTFSRATSINNSGAVVGYAENGTGGRRAVLWSNGIVTDLNNLVTGSYNFDTALDINNNGWILVEAEETQAILSPAVPTAITNQSLQTITSSPITAFIIIVAILLVLAIILSNKHLATR